MSTKITVQSRYEFFNYVYQFCYETYGVAIAQSVERLATGWKVWGSNTTGGENFHTSSQINYDLLDLLSAPLGVG
jgi:hypothetical protein